VSPVSLVTAAGASGLLIVLYLALGGATYKPLEVADPCEPRSLEQLREREDVVELLLLSTLDGAACRLRVTREELTLAVATPEALREFARTHHVRDEQIENAVRAGLERAVQDAQRVDAVTAFEAMLLREAIQRVPVSVLIDALQTDAGGDLLDLLSDLLGRGGEPGG
jgi:hypothetical protein